MHRGLTCDCGQWTNGSMKVKVKIEMKTAITVNGALIRCRSPFIKSLKNSYESQ